MSGALRTILVLCLLASIILTMLSVIVVWQLPKSDTTIKAPGEVKADRGHGSTTYYELIYSHKLERYGGFVEKFYNPGDNTTIWLLTMRGYGDTGIFVMKGRV